MVRSVTIGGTRYRVRRVRDLGRALAARGRRPESDLLGILLPDPPEILVRRSTPEEEASTLLHELLHASDHGLSEARVVEIEDCLFPVLWRSGWRPFGA